MEKEQSLASLYPHLMAATSKERIIDISDKDIISFITSRCNNAIIKLINDSPVSQNERKIQRKINTEKGDASICEFLLLYCETYCPKYKPQLLSSFSILDFRDSYIASGSNKTDLNFLSGYKNISDEAKNGQYDYLISRPEERKLHTILKAEKMRAALITGPARSGKTKLVYKYAADYPDCQVVMISVNDLVRDTMYRGTMEQRTKDIMNEACISGVTIFIDEIHSVWNIQNLADIIKPFISENGLKLIGASTEQDLRWISKKDPLLLRFTEIVIEPLSPDLIQKALEKHLEKKRQYYTSVVFRDDLLNVVYSLAIKLYPDQPYQVTEIGDRLIDLSMSNVSETTKNVTFNDILLAAQIITNKDNEFIFNLL